MQHSLDELRGLVAKRDRLRGALKQAQFEVDRLAERLREDGVPDGDVARALGVKPRPRLVRAPIAPRQPPPPRVDGRAEGFWTDD